MIRIASLILCLFAALPAFAAQYRPAVISFIDDDNDRWVYAFVAGVDGHLWARRFNGSAWEWTDHGLPEGASEIKHPQAVTYVDATGKRRIYIFAIDNNGRLVTRYHKGAGYNWAWTSQGGYSLEDEALAAATFPGDDGAQRIYVFGFHTPAIDTPKSLVTNYWDGTSWHWANLPVSSANHCTNPFLETTTYVGNDGQHRLDLFCANADLIRHSWVAGSFSVANLAGTPDVSATAVNFLSTSGTRVVYAFTPNPDTDRVSYSLGLAWGDLGTPNGNFGLHQVRNLAAVAYSDITGDKHMSLFVAQSEALYMRSWLNNTWQPWSVLDHPPGSPAVAEPAALTYLEPRDGRQRIYVFGVSQDRLWLDYWNGSTWQWIDQGIR